MENESRHQCMIYEGPPSQKLPMLAALLKRKMDEGYRCLYLNSPPMVAGMRSTLAALGVDVDYEIEEGRMILSSEQVLLDGEFNSELMLGKLDDFLNQALSAGYKGLWASGDMTWEFGPEKNFSKLLEYEVGLERFITKRREMHGICQYHRDTLPQEAMRQSLLTHPTLVISETLSRVNPHYLKPLLDGEEDKAANELDETIATLCESREG
jgi:hypothetical protein